MKKHRILWQKAAQFFEDAIAIWQSVPSNGELLDAHRQLLAELCALARDRVEFTRSLMPNAAITGIS